jgi:hypothetical protein
VDVGAGDLYRRCRARCRPGVAAGGAGLLALREEAGVAVQELVGRQILDLGMSFRLTGEDEERDWPLADATDRRRAGMGAGGTRPGPARACSKRWWTISMAKGAWSPMATCPPR